jgi:hypothetical protein
MLISAHRSRFKMRNRFTSVSNLNYPIVVMMQYKIPKKVKYLPKPNFSQNPTKTLRTICFCMAAMNRAVMIKSGKCLYLINKKTKPEICSYELLPVCVFEI